MSKRLIPGTAGFTLIETLIAMMVLASGLTATFRVMTATNHVNVNAQRNEAAISLAQREVEILRTMKYSELGMQPSATYPTGLSTTLGAQSLCWNNATTYKDLPCVRAGDSGEAGGCPRLQGPGTVTGTIPTTTAERIVMPANNGCQTYSSSTGFRVAPYSARPVTINSQTVTMKVWRYITWRNESCTGGCGTATGEQDTKRIVVVVVPDQGVTPNHAPKPVWLSSVAIDPDARPASVSLPDPAAASPLQKEQFFLYDRACAGTDPTIYAAPSPATHTTKDTAQGGSAGNSCGAAAISRPDLMASLGAPTYGGATNFSAETAGSTPGGLRLAPSTNCPAPTGYGGPSSKNTIHTWVTPKLSYKRIKGPIVFDFYAANAGTSSADEHVCLSLAQRNANGDYSSQSALGAAESSEACSQTVLAGTAGVTHVNCAFTLSPGTSAGTDPTDNAPFWNVAANQRLALTVSVESDTGSPDMFLLYDQSSSPSSLRFKTCKTPDMAGNTCS